MSKPNKRSKESRLKLYSYISLAILIIVIMGLYTRNEYNLNY